MTFVHRTALIVAALIVASSALAQDSSVHYRKNYQQQALEIYRHLVSIRSAAGHGNVPELAEYLARQFVAGGFDEGDVHVLPQTLSTDEETASLVVRYRGDGSSGKKPVLVIGHMDIVDAKPEDWERDPFTLIEEDGYFFGRGTLDNKFGITTVATTFLRLKREGFTPSRDLIIGFTGDEESGMETTRALATTYRNLTDAEYVLNADGGGGYLDSDGEPVAMLIQAAEKTYASFAVTVRNPGGHSSLPRKDNAIYELATVLKNIEAHEFPARINDVTRRYFELAAPLSPEPVRTAMRQYAEDPTNKDAQAVLSAIPSQVGVTRTTCVATMLEGGHAENALPQSATATINCRIFPGETAEDVQATLKAISGNPDVDLSLMAESLESPVSPMNEEVNAAVTRAVHDHYGDGVPIVPYMAPYGTDGKEMRRAGMPTYGVSALFMKNDEIFAHGLNERVPVESFYKALEYWHQVMSEVGGR